MRLLRRFAVLVENQVRFGHRLAQLLGAGRQRSGERTRGALVADAPDRGPLCIMRRTSRPCLSRWPQTDGSTLLHERRRVALCAERNFGKVIAVQPGFGGRQEASASRLTSCFRCARATRRSSRTAPFHQEARLRWIRRCRAYRPCPRRRRTSGSLSPAALAAASTPAGDPGRTLPDPAGIGRPRLLAQPRPLRCRPGVRKARTHRSSRARLWDVPASHETENPTVMPSTRRQPRRPRGRPSALSARATGFDRTEAWAVVPDGARRSGTAAHRRGQRPARAWVAPRAECLSAAARSRWTTRRLLTAA